MEMTTAKTVAVFVIIIGCFAVLYPKIFHPMIMHMFGAVPPKQNHDDILNRIPPHLRKPPGAGPMDDMHKHMRPGPHPGLRAAAEMKKQAATTGSAGAGRGLMGVVLPMYAVGIVVYLIYTLTKVFGKSEKQPTTDYLGKENPFSDIRYNADRKKFVTRFDEDTDNDRGGKRQLEKLLLKADERSITETELHQLKSRLLETEAQMTRILRAMETVTTQVSDVADQVVPGGGAPVKEQVDQQDLSSTRTSKSFDSSPDMETYEIVSGKQQKAGKAVEDIGAGKIGECEAKRTTSAHGYNQTDDDAGDEEEDELSRDEDADDEGADDGEEEVEEYDEEYDDEESEEARLGEDDEDYEEDEMSEEEEDEEEVECIEKVIGKDSDEDADQRVDDAHPDLRKRKMPANVSSGGKPSPSSQ